MDLMEHSDAVWCTFVETLFSHKSVRGNHGAPCFCYSWGPALPSRVTPECRRHGLVVSALWRRWGEYIDLCIVPQCQRSVNRASILSELALSPSAGIVAKTCDRPRTRYRDSKALEKCLITQLIADAGIVTRSKPTLRGSNRTVEQPTAGGGRQIGAGRPMCSRS